MLTSALSLHRGTKGARCTYDQFVHGLGGAHERTGYEVLQSDGTLDVEKSAIATYKTYHKKPGDGTKIPNFEGQVAVKGTWEFNQLIMKVGNVVDKTYKAKQAKLTDEQKKLFKNFGTCQL